MFNGRTEGIKKFVQLVDYSQLQLRRLYRLLDSDQRIKWLPLVFRAFNFKEF